MLVKNKHYILKYECFSCFTCHCTWQTRLKNHIDINSRHNSFTLLSKTIFRDYSFFVRKWFHEFFSKMCKITNRLCFAIFVTFGMQPGTFFHFSKVRLVICFSKIFRWKDNILPFCRKKYFHFVNQIAFTFFCLFTTESFVYNLSILMDRKKVLSI